MKEKEEDFRENITQIARQFNTTGRVLFEGSYCTSKEKLIKTILKVNTDRRINGMTSLSDKELARITTDLKVSKSVVASEDLDNIYETIKALHEIVYKLESTFTDIRTYATLVETDEDKKEVK
jgi:hypothetical protein